MAETQKEMVRVLERIERGIDKLAQSSARGARSKGRAAGSEQTDKPQSLLTQAKTGLTDLAAGRAFGGGLAGLAGSAGLAGVGAGLAFAGQGLVRAQQGGSFAGGTARAGINALSAVPFLGELTGASEARRVLDGTESRLNAATNFAARYGGKGAVTPEVREFLAKEFGRQERNVEADRQANAAVISKTLSDTAGGDSKGVLLQLVSILERLESWLTTPGRPNPRGG